MKAFKQKALASAVVASTMLVAGAANAVYVNPDGLGNALVYPYYTTRGGNVTLVSVVNTANVAKVVKVRFLEGKNSQEVLDFNLFLSPKDVWTGGIAPATLAADFGLVTPALGGSALSTFDRSCTNPSVYSRGASGVAFRNNQFLADKGAGFDNTGLDRTNEGYVEVLEMADIITSSALYADVKHTSANSFTPACKLVGGSNVLANVNTYLTNPTGGLFGSGSIINPAAGTNSGYDAVAFADWNNSVSFTQSGDTSPRLIDGSSTTSVVTIGSNVYVSNWASGRDAVTASIMHDKVMNEYSYLDTGTVGTDWVMTMPTKRFFVNGVSSAIRPFQNIWNKQTSRDDFNVADFDREEYSATSTTNDDFSPRPVGEAADCTAQPSNQGNSLLSVQASLCYEANVLGFGKIVASPASQSNVLASKNFFNLVTAVQNQGKPITGGTNTEGGWATLTFPPGGAAGSQSYHMLPNAGETTIVDLTSTNAPATAQSVTYYGLPVVGFSVSQVKTSSASTSFAAAFNHRYTKSITDPRVQVVGN